MPFISRTFEPPKQSNSLGTKGNEAREGEEQLRAHFATRRLVAYGRPEPGRALRQRIGTVGSRDSGRRTAPVGPKPRGGGTGFPSPLSHCALVAVLHRARWTPGPVKRADR